MYPSSIDFINSFVLKLYLFKATATTEFYTLSLHDALPICRRIGRSREGAGQIPRQTRPESRARLRRGQENARSEEHTSELQSRRDLVCRLLLEKKKGK